MADRSPKSGIAAACDDGGPRATTALAIRLATITVALIGSVDAGARGASPYLPWSLSPEIERQIERVLILADRPVLTRPIAAATVLDALPAACERDAALCESVRRYLDGYVKDYGIGYLSASLAATSDDAVTLPNRHGMTADSSYEAAAQVFWQPSNALIFSGGLVAYDGDVTPTGTMVSIGTEHVQIDVGFRDHWLSPLTDSSMLIGTEAQTMPSVTVSNYTPLTRWGFRYEVFVAEMSETANITFGTRFTSGRPRLAGVHLSIEPFPGWALGLNRILQIGGGERSDSFRDLFDAFVRPSKYDNTVDRTDPNAQFGNQAASVTARYLSPGRLPFAVYFEYAGEDTSTNSNFRLGNASLSAGVQFPDIFRNIDLTFEMSEWQNGWYVHGVYLDGLRNEGNVIGHWGADQRVVGDGVGARSLMARAGWQPSGGGWIELTYRRLVNAAYTEPDYGEARFLTARYSRELHEFRVGADIESGRDSFGQSFSRLGLFLRF